MFYDLLKSRRSIRNYEDKEIEKEKIDIILKSALLSPSSRGRRPWEFISITDKEILQTLSLCREHGSNFLSGAALGIVVIADKEKCDVWVEDSSIASIIIQLAAHSLELGSCWIQIRDRMHNNNLSAEDYIKKILQIPDKYSVESIISIGYSAEEKQPHKEETLLYEKIHHGKY